MPKKSDIQKVVDTLNDAFKRDPAAISALVRHRLYCNRSLADHPTIQVREGMEGTSPIFTVSPIGLLNGVLEPITGKRIAIRVTDGKVLGFTVYKK